MNLSWGFGINKYYREKITKEEAGEIFSLKPGELFKNHGDIKWISIYLYEDGEYVVCLDQIGEAYYEGSLDLRRFGNNINLRLESPKHVFVFLENYVLKDQYFTK